MLQRRFHGVQQLCGYGAGTDCLDAPPVAWCGQDTYIQKTGIAQDFGTFADPDRFYAGHRQNMGPVGGWLYRRIVRHWMNVRVRALRAGGLTPQAGLTHKHKGARNAV